MHDPDPASSRTKNLVQHNPRIRARDARFRFHPRHTFPSGESKRAYKRNIYPEERVGCDCGHPKLWHALAARCAAIPLDMGNAATAAHTSTQTGGAVLVFFF
jgi:hypothetical protein